MCMKYSLKWVASASIKQKLVAKSVDCAKIHLLMATARKTRFSRRVPDHVTDELVVVLSEETEFLHFNDLFQKVYDNLKKKNAVSGGEEMLRLRAYEKLQNLVSRGMVNKEARQYLGLDGIERASSKWQAEQQKIADDAAEEEIAKTAKAAKA